MDVESGRATVSDLSFRVYERALHPDWFATRVHRRLTHRRWSADVRIIEGGHVVTWAAGPVRLCEVLSAPAASLPEEGLSFRSPVRHERSTLLEPDPAVSYQSCFEAERVDRTVFAHVCDELALDGTRERMFYRAPTQNRLMPQPISLIKLESSARRLTLFAVHTFPEELTILRVQSLFELNA